MYSSVQKSVAVPSTTNVAAISTTNVAAITTNNVAYDVPKTKVSLQEMDGDVEHQYESIEEYDRLAPISSSVSSKPPQKLYADCAAYEAMEICHS